MKPFKNKLAVTIVVLSVAFLGIITFSIKSNSTIISSGVGGVISPLQKIVHVVNKKVTSRQGECVRIRSRGERESPAPPCTPSPV